MNIDPAITIDMALNTGTALLGYFYIMFCSGRWLSLLFKNGINAVSRSNARRQWMHFSKPSIDSMEPVDPACVISRGDVVILYTGMKRK